MGKYDDKKPRSGSKWIGLLIFLMFANPALFIPLAVIGGTVYLVSRNLKTGGKSSSGTYRQPPVRYTTRQEKFDECPQPLFCRHKDKGEHHVRRGREIDPWDRPDIDISKYQRNR
ncbi:MAG: hypothetical protein E7465_00580 [Ruminococcaceae bacterium]|nr:hypothetical protein [Oscillospiraceae bacterium]